MVLIEQILPDAYAVERAPRVGPKIRTERSSNWPNQTIASIKSLLLEHRVKLHVDQGRRGDGDQERFAVRFGKLLPHGIIGVTKGTASIVKLGSVLRAGLGDVCHAYCISSMRVPRVSACELR